MSLKGCLGSPRTWVANAVAKLGLLNHTPGHSLCPIDRAWKERQIPRGYICRRQGQPKQRWNDLDMGVGRGPVSGAVMDVAEPQALSATAVRDESRKAEISLAFLALNFINNVIVASIYIALQGWKVIDIHYLIWSSSQSFTDGK